MPPARTILRCWALVTMSAAHVDANLVRTWDRRHGAIPVALEPLNVDIQGPASDAVSRFAAAAQTARTSASRLTAYSSSQQTAASQAAEACAAMSCAPSSR